jgi:hypothetical protein
VHQGLADHGVVLGRNIHNDDAPLTGCFEQIDQGSVVAYQPEGDNGGMELADPAIGAVVVWKNSDAFGVGIAQVGSLQGHDFSFGYWGDWAIPDLETKMHDRAPLKRSLSRLGETL